MRIWLFGEHYVSYSLIPVPSGAVFNFTMDGNQTAGLQAGTYRTIFQYPRSGATFEIGPSSRSNSSDLIYDSHGKLLINLQSIRNNSVNGLDAAEILQRELQKPGSRDTVSVMALDMEDPLITIDPIPETYLGDIIVFKGTTNLPVNDTIDVRPKEFVIKCTKGIPNPDSVSGCWGTFHTIVQVKQGKSRINSWTLSLNTSYNDFRSGGYMVEVLGERISDKIYNGNRTSFTILPRPAVNPFRHIFIETTEQNLSGNILRISGTANTGLGPREKIHMQVTSEKNDTPFMTAVFPVFPERSGYHWNYTLSTSGLTPGNYTITLISDEDRLVRNSTTFFIPYVPIQISGGSVAPASPTVMPGVIP